MLRSWPLKPSTGLVSSPPPVPFQTSQQEPEAELHCGCFSSIQFIVPVQSEYECMQVLHDTRAVFQNKNIICILPKGPKVSN